jgi:hypothetical protein
LKINPGEGMVVAKNLKIFENERKHVVLVE